MDAIQSAGAAHGPRLHQARHLFFERGERPADLVAPAILRSWERCRHFGLRGDAAAAETAAPTLPALADARAQNHDLLRLLRPIMEHVYEQIRDSGNMVILADARGLLLDTVGDPDFVGRADRVALAPGALWDEQQCGTNAIGTALAEERPVEVLGSEHYLARNGFLTCCASPIFSPDGALCGVLDISGDYRTRQAHTLGLARLSAALAEKRLFESTHATDIVVAFHECADYLGSPKEGLAAVTADGQVRAINRYGLEILGRHRDDAVHRDFSLVFAGSLATLIDHQRRQPAGYSEVTIDRRLCLQLRGSLPTPISGRLLEAAPVSAPRQPAPAAAAPLDLDTLNTGDPYLQAAIDRARRMLGRDIPLLIQGESGAGKEMFAKAFHHSGPRRSGPFVALNCAAIPDSLIESELFGYQGGAFTGARREGAVGKIRQAHGGTLFLDEIGDMPLSLQARLLRVLQERCVTPLGSAQTIPVDLSLVCATHRHLPDEVAAGRFREDLYYRLNGLGITLPPLRERCDIRQLVARIVAEEAGDRQAPLDFSESALRAIEGHAWPGNIRQLFNVIRVAIALLDTDETLIDDRHLPEELLATAALPHPAKAAAPAGSLREIGRQAAQQALQAANGNVSAAARHLGISRNTLYRKLSRL